MYTCVCVCVCVCVFVCVCVWCESAIARPGNTIHIGVLSKPLFTLEIVPKGNNLKVTKVVVVVGGPYYPQGEIWAK
jgi:hypothetical protein